MRNKNKLLNTWDILYDIRHKGAEVTSDVLQCIRVLVIFSLQQLPGQINILQQCTVQRVALSIQTSASSLKWKNDEKKTPRCMMHVTEIPTFYYTYHYNIFRSHTSDWWRQHQLEAQISGPAGPWGYHDACVASCSAQRAKNQRRILFWLKPPFLYHWTVREIF